jgi:hypothetical protein
MRGRKIAVRLWLYSDGTVKLEIEIVTRWPGLCPLGSKPGLG